MNDFNPNRTVPSAVPVPPAPPPLKPAQTVSSVAIAPQSPPLIVPPPPSSLARNASATSAFDFPEEILRRPERKSLWGWIYERWLKSETNNEQEKVRRIPSWLLSFVVHLTLLVVLAMIPLARMSSGPLVLMFGDSGQDGLSDFELSGAGQDTPEVAEAEFQEQQPEIQFSQVLEALELPSLTEVKVDTSASESPSTTMELTNIPNGIRDGLQGRTGALKGALLNKFGGNGQTEAAVDLGLQWLAKYQTSDGSWSLIGPYADGGAVENRTAATAMAVNAFLGAGNTPDNGKYAENVRLGLAYLIRRQGKDGFFAGKEPTRQQAYAQAIATIAVCEAFGMTGDSKFRVAAEKALKYAAWSQSDLKGWRYDPDDRKDADLSVTGWYLMALVTGKMVNLAIDEDVLKSVTTYLDMVSHDEKSRYSYTTIENTPDLVMTAEGLLCRIYLGWQRSEQALLMAIRDDLLPNRPDLNNKTTSVYFWYYATQVLHHVGGESWQEWNDAMKKVLPAIQERKGKDAGSWDPDSDHFGAAGGRLYVTCFNIYCLEVYYRHLAMYDIK